MTAAARSRRGLALLAVALALLAPALLAPRDASAHALLVRSDPPINASLRESPTTITLFMSEPLQQDFSSVQVIDARGQHWELEVTQFNPRDATQMSVRVPRLPPNVYTVLWRTLSLVDGHTWNGSYTFTVLNPDGSAPAGAAFNADLSTPGPPSAADAAVKAFAFFALFLLGGGALFALLAGRAARMAGSEAEPLAAIARRHAWAAARLAVVLLFLTTAYDVTSAALKLGSFNFIDDILGGTRNGLWLQMRWSFLLAGSVLLVARGLPRWRRNPDFQRGALIGMAVLAAGIAASLSGISHGAAIDRGGIWGTLFDVLHLATATVWIGMLGALIWTLWSGRGLGEAATRRRFQIEAVRRFSWVAAASVPVLIAAGLLSALIQVPVARGLIDTDWGTAFLVKLGILLPLFGVALANAVWLRPRAEEGGVGVSPSLERRFRWTMRAEVLLAMAVLAATGALTQLPSPRSAISSAPEKDNTIVRTLNVDDLVANVRISPNTVGQNTYRAEFRSEDGGPPADEILEVRFHFNYEEEAVGGVIVPAEETGENTFVLDGSYFGLAGEWTVGVEVRRATRDDAIAELTTDVEQGFVSVLPFNQSEPGPLSLPISQMDWNGIAGLWAAVACGLLVGFRGTLRKHVSQRAGNTAFAGGTLFMVAAVVLITGVHVEPGRTLQNPVAATEASVANGRQLFAANCAQCHGADGGGDGPLAGTLPAPPANFRVHVPFHPDGVLFNWISEGIPGTGMPAWESTLSQDERWDLVNFLRANFDQPLGGG